MEANICKDSQVSLFLVPFVMKQCNIYILLSNEITDAVKCLTAEVQGTTHVILVRLMSG